MHELKSKLTSLRVPLPTNAITDVVGGSITSYCNPWLGTKLIQAMTSILSTLNIDKPNISHFSIHGLERTTTPALEVGIRTVAFTGLTVPRCPIDLLACSTSQPWKCASARVAVSAVYPFLSFGLCLDLLSNSGEVLFGVSYALLIEDGVLPRAKRSRHK